MAIVLSLLAVAAVAVVVAMAVSVYFHFYAVRRSNPTTATVWVMIAHGVPWLTLIAVLSFVVPKLKKAFTDFGTELPQLARLVIGISDAYITMFVLFSALIFVLLPIDAVVFLRLRQEEATKRYSKIWSRVMTAVPLLLLTTVVLALAAPLINLMNDLS